jgi:hypothetical protein
LERPEPENGRADTNPVEVRRVRTHIKALTYAPKIPGVLSGEIRQTIRPTPSPINYRRCATDKEIIAMREKVMLAIVREGDYVLFHGWEGKPYRSPWSWRLKVRVYVVLFCKMYKEGISIPQPRWGRLTMRTHSLGFMPWSECDALAHMDGIKDGKTMGEVFNSMYVLESYYDNGINQKATKYFQIIRWSWPPVGVNQ